MIWRAISLTNARMTTSLNYGEFYNEFIYIHILSNNLYVLRSFLEQ